METIEQQDTELKEQGIEIPPWIEQDISVYDLESICQGGCASGAYMPAVTYYTAKQTMNEHGDDVLEFIENWGDDDMPPVPKGISWSGVAVFYLSCAVELWAYSVQSEIEGV